MASGLEPAADVKRKILQGELQYAGPDFDAQEGNQEIRGLHLDGVAGGLCQFDLIDGRYLEAGEAAEAVFLGLLPVRRAVGGLGCAKGKDGGQDRGEESKDSFHVIGCF